MYSNTEVRIVEFRGHPVFTIEVDGKPRFRFGKTKAQYLLDNWELVTSFARTGEGNMDYHGYDLVELEMTNDRTFRFGLQKARLCVEAEEQLREFAATSREELLEGTNEPNSADSEDDVARDCLLLALQVAYADSRIIDVEVEEVRKRFDTEGQASELMVELLELVRSGKADIDRALENLNSKLKPEEKEVVVEQLFDIAAADGLFHGRESKILISINQALEVPGERIQRLLRVGGTVPYGDSEVSEVEVDEPAQEAPRARLPKEEESGDKIDAINRLKELLEPTATL